jgi:hypothetical protein
VIPFYDFKLGGSSLIADYIRSPLELAPLEQHVSLLVRHSIRFPINLPEETWLASLTPAGIQLAEEFGAWLAPRRCPYRVMTSPVGRCIETSRSIIRGANWPNPVVIDQRLGFPFIEKGWQRLNTDGTPVEIPHEALEVLDYLLKDTTHAAGLNLFVSHDGNIAFMATALLGEPITEENWPDFLEGMAFWREKGAVRIAWRDKIYELKNQRVFSLDLIQS